MSDKKILVVDDEPNLRLLVTKILEMEKYTVIAAADGEAGLKMAREENPDLILLDIIMPKKNGYQVATELNLDKKTKEIPVILMTGTSQMVGEGIQLETPAVAKLPKPFGKDELVNVVKKVLG